MLFEFKSIYHGGTYQHNESNMPPWLTSKENKWFLDDYVLKLSVGESTESEYHIITRIK